VSHFDARAATWDDDPAKVSRAREVAEAIRAAVPVSPAMSVLEYGCGTGLLGLALAPHVARVAMADSSDGMLEVLRRKLEAGAAPNGTALKLDLEREPLPADRYHLVCSLLTLHHVHDLDRVLGQLRVALLPGGTLCVADLDAEDGSFHGHGADVHRGFDRAALAARLRAAGFSEPAFTTACEIERALDGAPRRFGVFLAVARTA
jgi:ubiquinone/menaquinone biosynthesis C-methylase UbiE